MMGLVLQTAPDFIGTGDNPAMEQRFLILGE